MHRRIDDSGVNLEITNPMFGEDEDPYTNDTHTQAIPINLDNKVCLQWATMIDKTIIK